ALLLADPLLLAAPIALSSASCAPAVHRASRMQAHAVPAGSLRAEWTAAPSDACCSPGEIVWLLQDARDVEADGLVKLQRVGREPEVMIGQEQLIDRRKQLDRRLDVDEVVPAIGQRLDAEASFANTREIDLRRWADVAVLLAQRSIQIDHEVEEIQIVLEE